MNRNVFSSQNSMRSVLAVFVAVGILSGCAVDMPSKITPGRAQLVTQNHSDRFVTTEAGSAQFDQIAAHYTRYGSGQAEVIVGYDPHAKNNTAMKASDQLHRVTSELAARGLKNVKGSIMAIEGSGEISEMIVGYTAITATPPEDCRMMPGYETNQAMADFDYKLGCSVETMVSRQIAHPEDLAGRAPDSTGGDGRRATGITEPYRTGTPNTAMSGAYSSSGN